MRHLPGAAVIAKVADRAERLATRNKDGRNLQHPRAAARKSPSAAGFRHNGDSHSGRCR
ncbi:hypothetical protein I551_2127 [Mycobacterium ulcerans str. Harvey]|uniref:Uncharacterized protein n=1 Tax=Mycobacterium ulcerans str. Harvey TaxID=1299332 RepID=A0ABP3AMK3_MYCUL|nr:hypothetical protein I551_2127 [Mycobacterium ulcerans str. Harvey]